MRLDLLLASRLPVVLLVSHAFGGGVARHIGDLEKGIEGRAVALRLQPHGDRHVVLRSALPDQPALWFDVDHDWESLVALLQGIGIDRVHFHHVHGWPRKVLDLPRLCGCPHLLTLHDYFPACPAYHLKDRSLRYCGGMADCGKCLEAPGSAWGLSIPEWRALFGEVLATAERVIAPSQAAADKLRIFFDEVSTVVWPHPDEADQAVAPPLRVLVPGAISIEKGLDILEACVRDAAARSLPLHFHVAGFIGRPLPLWPDLPLTVSGQYGEGALPRLLALERDDVAFFPAQCPETFSYTLSAVLATDMAVVATDLGAFPERLASRGNARIVPWTSSPRDFNAALLAAAAPPAAPRSNRHVITALEYGVRYMEGLRRTASQAALPALDPRWLVEPPLDSPYRTLDWLFRDGVVAGNAASTAKLRRRQNDADSQLAALTDDLSETRRRLDACEVQLRAAQSQVEHERGRAQADTRAASEARRDLDQVRTSRSWRLTAPLRGLARRMRGR